MFVAIAKLFLDFYGNTELPKKRYEMKQLCSLVHRKHNVSAHEIIEKLDDPERCILGLSLTASSRVDARKAIDHIVEFVDSIAFARVTTQDIDVFQME